MNNIQRMAELMQPVDQQIQMCDDQDEVLMMACAMMHRSQEIFDQILGQAGRKKMFRDLV